MRRAMPDSLLTQIRKSRGLSLEDVAAKVGCNAGTLSRVERGEQTPKQSLARALHKFFGGAVPLGAIYDAAFPD